MIIRYLKVFAPATAVNVNTHKQKKAAYVM